MAECYCAVNGKSTTDGPGQGLKGVSVAPCALWRKYRIKIRALAFCWHTERPNLPGIGIAGWTNTKRKRTGVVVATASW
jgi:hypothetical protein